MCVFPPALRISASRLKMWKGEVSENVTIIYFAAMMLGLISLAVLSYFWLDFRGVFRGRRLVMTSEGEEPTAAKAPVTAGAIGIRLQDCSHWSGLGACGPKCLSRLKAAPADCLIRTTLTKWYQGKSCAGCGKAYEETEWFKHQLCVINPERQTFEWKDITAEMIPGVLETYEPVCWNCHIAENFRNQFPKLVLDRDREG
jgi:hypothetical protein